jgi:hypothetical protein
MFCWDITMVGVSMVIISLLLGAVGAALGIRGVLPRTQKY